MGSCGILSPPRGASIVCPEVHHLHAAKVRHVKTEALFFSVFFCIFAEWKSLKHFNKHLPEMALEDQQDNKRALDFEEYIRASEPHKRERAYAWRTAIGLQAVDGLQVSDYLKQTAHRNIEGEITIDEARELVNTYYVSKTKSVPDDDNMQEADRVSANIAKLLGEETFAFTVAGLTAIHRRIFEGVFKFAGEIRDL